MEVTRTAATGCEGGWSIASAIDWGTVDAAAANKDAEILMLVRRAALRAARRSVGLSHLLVALVMDSVASAILAHELHDSWKHFHALRSYLEVVEYTPAIAEAELDQHRRTAPDAALKRFEDVAASVLKLVDEAARDSALFSLIGSRALDPALARLAGRIAADRQRHSLSLARLVHGDARQPAGMTA